jgi:hypothetical protein
LTCSGTLYWPDLTPYDNRHQSVITQHFDWMQAAGITAVIVSWWGAGSHSDVALPLIIKTAASFGMKVAFGIPQLNGWSPTHVLTYLLQTYGDEGPILRVQGQPVFFINTVAWSVGGDTGWQSAAQRAAQNTGIVPWLAANILASNGFIQGSLGGAVQAAYRYSTHADFAPLSGITTLEQIEAKAPDYYATQVAAVGDAVSIAVVLPRHNGTRVHSGVQDLIVEGHDGQTMFALLHAASAANPDWIAVVSWNEWGEGSMLEPSKQFGRDAFHGQLAAAFRAKAPKTHHSV